MRKRERGLSNSTKRVGKTKLPVALFAWWFIAFPCISSFLIESNFHSLHSISTISFYIHNTAIEKRVAEDRKKNISRIELVNVHTTFWKATRVLNVCHHDIYHPPTFLYLFILFFIKFLNFPINIATINKKSQNTRCEWSLLNMCTHSLYYFSIKGIRGPQVHQKKYKRKKSLVMKERLREGSEREEKSGFMFGVKGFFFILGLLLCSCNAMLFFHGKLNWNKRV